MNNDLKVYINDENKLFIAWDEYDYATKYSILLMDDDFNFYTYKETKENSIIISKKDLKGFIGIRIEYIMDDKAIKREFPVAYSNVFRFDTIPEIKELTLSSIESYNGITISFFSKDIYDIYKLYKVEKDSLVFIEMSEDFQMTSRKIKENEKYLVQAFRREKDDYVLCASSDVYTCKTKDVIRKSNSVPKISIIVPVYNSEQFISRCIDSVLLSTFNDVELLLIDDGSKDNSAKILDWYQRKYPTIVKVTHKENEGVAYTRNKGIDLAIGKFIAFIDNDDMVHPYMYECLYKSAMESKADVAIAKTIIRTNINEYSLYMNYRKDNKDYFVYTYDEMMDIFEETRPYNIYFVAVWNKIIKRSIAKGKYFDKQNYYEDQAYTRMIYSYCDRFVFCYDAYYLWDKRIQKTKGTQSNTYTVNNNADMLRYNLYVMYSDSYGFKAGNKKRLDRLSNAFVRDAYNNIKIRYQNNRVMPLYQAYRQVMIDMNKKVDLLNNKYINRNKDIVKFVEEVLEEDDVDG